MYWLTCWQDSWDSLQNLIYHWTQFIVVTMIRATRLHPQWHDGCFIIQIWNSYASHHPCESYNLFIKCLEPIMLPLVELWTPDILSTNCASTNRGVLFMSKKKEGCGENKKTHCCLIMWKSNIISDIDNCAHKHSKTNTHIHTSSHTHTSKHTRARTHACAHTHTCMETQVFTHTCW